MISLFLKILSIVWSKSSPKLIVGVGGDGFCFVVVSMMVTDRMAEICYSGQLYNSIQEGV